MTKFSKSFFLSVFVLFSVLIRGQTNSRFLIRFTDKNASPFSLSSPNAYLSQRAIDRRTKQNITIKNNDLPVNGWYVDSIINTGVKLLGRSKWLNGVVIDTIGFPNAMATINSFSFVQSINPVGIIKQSNDMTAFYQKQYPPIGYKFAETEVKVPYGAAYNYGSSFTQDSMIGADCMHSQGYSGEGMVIAVIDDGFYHVDQMAAFDSIRINNRILGAVDIADPGTSVYDEDAHGMYVLSSIAGYLPGQLVGTAPKAKFWLLRSEVAATENLIEEVFWTIAAEFADSVGADVINSSLGYTTFDIASQNHTYSDMNGKTTYCSMAATTAAQKGILVVVSAGNSGGTASIGSPADADSIITVGAVDAYGFVANFSSRGPSSDGRIKPDVMAEGQGCTLAAISGGTLVGNGTSFSSPITAGAVACLWQANPNRSNMQILQAVRESANLYGNPNYDYGYGIPNMCVANAILNGASVADFEKDNLFKVFPSPFTDQIRVEFNSESSQSVKVQLFDVAGKKLADVERNVKENSLTIFTITELQAVQSGMYFVIIKTLNRTYSKKVIKGGDAH